MKKLLLLAVICLLAIGLVACGPTEQPTQQPDTSGTDPVTTPEPPPADNGDKHLIVAVDPDYESFDPALAYEVYAMMVLHSCYDTLFEFHDRLENLEYGAAASHTLSEDNLVYTFQLKPDMVFASGNPVTAEDFKWTIERGIHMQGNGAFLAEGIASIEAPDDLTLIITLKDPDPSFPTKLSYTFFGAVDRQVAEENGATNAADAATTDTAKAWFDSNSAGSGPYYIESYTPKVEVVLARNENYWGELPYYEKITIQTIADSNTQVMMLRTGDIDIAINVDPEQAKSLSDDPNITVRDAQSLTMSFLLMNRDAGVGGPVADPKVQKAIRMALDYEGIQQLAGPGMTTPVATFPVGLFGSLPSKDVAGLRDVEGAKALLAEAGYADGFSTSFYVPQTIVAGVDLNILSQKIQADLKEIGIETTIIPEDVTVSLETYRTGQQSLGLWYWNPDYPDNNSQLAFLPGEKVGLRAQWTAEQSPELAALGKQAATETDDDKRAELLAEIQNMMDEDTAFAVLLQHTSQYATKSNLVGVDYIDRYKIDLKTVRPQ